MNLHCIKMCSCKKEINVVFTYGLGNQNCPVFGTCSRETLLSQVEQLILRQDLDPKWCGCWFVIVCHSNMGLILLQVT